MSDIYDELGVDRYINAFGPFTIYGGSRMTERTYDAMIKAGQSFVEVRELQEKVGRAIAGLTHNEAAYVTSGASAGITLTIGVLIAGDDIETFRKLPKQDGTPKNVIVLNCQRAIFWEPVRTSGAELKIVGTPEGTSGAEIKQAVDKDTVAVVYYTGTHLTKNAPPLEEVIEAAHEAGVPVVVDSASFLPPATNLWKFTEMGADAAIFSGGKAIAGPQGSGLIVGKQYIVDRCLKYGYPNMGLNRGCKIGKEEIAGYYEALKQFLEVDVGKQQEDLACICQILADALSETGAFEVRIGEKGSIGQDIPTVYGTIKGGFSPEEFKNEMHRNKVFIGAKEDFIFLSPYFLRPEEIEPVAEAVRTSVRSLTGQ